MEHGTWGMYTHTHLTMFPVLEGCLDGPRTRVGVGGRGGGGVGGWWKKSDREMFECPCMYLGHLDGRCKFWPYITGNIGLGSSWVKGCIGIPWYQTSHTSPKQKKTKNLRLQQSSSLLIARYISNERMSSSHIYLSWDICFSANCTLRRKSFHQGKNKIVPRVLVIRGLKKECKNHSHTLSIISCVLCSFSLPPYSANKRKWKYNPICSKSQDRKWKPLLPRK